MERTSIFCATSDVRLLATAAEDARVDLRILVLKRSAYDVTRSEIVRRHWGGVELMRVLIDNEFVLAGQLRSIATAFFLCVNLFGDLPGELTCFLHPYFAGDGLHLFSEMKEQIKVPHHNNTLPMAFEPWADELSVARSQICPIDRLEHTKTV